MKKEEKDEKRRKVEKRKCRKKECLDNHSSIMKQKNETYHRKQCINTMYQVSSGMKIRSFSVSKFQYAVISDYVFNLS
jgi:hypothetical protein